MKRLLPLLALPLVLSGCDLFGPDTGPPAEITRSGIPGDLVAGDTLDVTVTVRDEEGRALEGATVTWTASPGTTALPAESRTNGEGIAVSRWALGPTAGSHRLTATAGDVEVVFPAHTRPAPLDRIVVEPAEHRFESIGDTVTLSARGEDRFGNTVSLSGATWLSTDPEVASVVDGVVVSHGEGQVEVRAMQGGIRGGADVTVEQVVVGLRVRPLDPIYGRMVTGESADFVALPVDARAVPVDTPLAFTWSSSAPGVAAVDAGGAVQAVAPGTTVIGAAGGGFSGDVTVEVTDGERPTIAGITPAVLEPGDTVQIAGTGFPDDASLVSVTVGGAPLAVLTTGPTALTVRMPVSAELPCARTSQQDVVVEVDRLATRASHPVGGARRHSLGVGGSVALFGSDVACNEITEPGRYVVSVFNSTPTASSATAFRLRGHDGDGGPSLVAADRLPRVRVAEERRLEARPGEVAHLDLLEENRRIVEALGPRDRTPPAPARLTAAGQVGELREFRIPDLDGANLCVDYIGVTARAVYVGDFGVIWEDTLAPLAGTMDDRWQEMGREYDQIMHPILAEYFGDPLVFDDRLDGDGRFYMLFSESVNDFERGVNGFVTAADFYPRTQCASGDNAEIFYGRVPTSGSADYGVSGSVPGWAWGMRSTIIHEVKHLTAYANKFDLDPARPNLEESGLEEATARLSEELYGRALQGYGQFDNVGYDASIWCERRVGSNYPDCDRVPTIMGKHYGGINAYLKSPAQFSPFGRVSDDDWSFYGSGWQWVRWAIDQSGVPEADFIRALIREPSLRGPANLAARAGRPVPELLADYTLAFAIDDHPSGLVPDRSELDFPGWDTRDMFAGLHDDYADTGIADTYPTPWPLAVQQLGSAGFDVEVAEIRGGGAAIFEMTGGGSRLLELRSVAGGTAPGALGLALVRVE